MEDAPTPAPEQETSKLDEGSPVYPPWNDAAAAGDPRGQGSRGGGRGFPQSMVPTAREGDGDGKEQPHMTTPTRPLLPKVEPVFGQVKEGQGFRRFMRRGLGTAQSEWFLAGMTHNLLKLWRSGQAPWGWAQAPRN